VTGLRVLVGEEPRGECELHRICAVGRNSRGIDDEDSRGIFWECRGDVRRVFMSARDMAGAPR
jgi:hypothetical protein